MSSIYLKISSLLIRTLSKPIANSIKAQAREHEGFRKICISFAQSVHRLDMRLRLGLLQDQAAIDRQIAREAAAKKAKSEIPTVKTEAQTKADEAQAHAHEMGDKVEKERKRTPPKIRPLSEAKAIDSGANFISEGFLFSVGLGLILFETWRSRRKENTRRSDVAEQIAALESQNQALAEKVDSMDKQLLELRTEGTASSLWQKWHSKGHPKDGASSKTSAPTKPAEEAGPKSANTEAKSEPSTDQPKK